MLRNQDTSVSQAKRAISDYKKAVGDPAGLAELMVFYCEQAAGFCSDIYTEDQGYFNALLRMFEQALKFANARTGCQLRFGMFLLTIRIKLGLERLLILAVRGMTGPCAWNVTAGHCVQCASTGISPRHLVTRRVGFFIASSFDLSIKRITDPS